MTFDALLSALSTVLVKLAVAFALGSACVVAGLLVALLFMSALPDCGGTRCRDGWVSRSHGSGACSHHGGVAR